MKKIFLSLAVIASVALVSCGGNKAKEEAADSANVEVVEEAVVVDTPCCGDSNCTETAAVEAVAVEEPAK